VADKLSAVESIFVVGMPSAVQPTVATDNLPFVVIGPMVGQTAAPWAKIAKLLVVIVDLSTAHLWLAADKFLADKQLVDGLTFVVVSPSAAEPILVVNSFAVVDLDLIVERMTLFVANHREQTAILGKHHECMLILEFE
jgi:hypothetical protein